MIGLTVSRYKILEKLGEGGMGEVYLAEDTELRRRVALKVLRAETAADDELLQRFRREARAVAALNHPNIVTIHSVEAAEIDGEAVHFLTMELVDGVGLDRKIPSEGLDRDRIFELAVPLADALSAAHKEGITHRDLKPANVMLTADGRVKILDFGLAKLAEEDGGDEDTTQALTEAGMVMGTMPYMSPEQVSGKPVDHRTDIFAMGVILYEMATGHRPFAGESSGHLISSILRDDPPSVTELRQELPFHLGRIIRRCLEKDPDRRYQSALDIRNELEALKEEVHSGAVSAVSEVVPAPTPPAPKRPLWLTAGVPAAVVLIAALAWVALRGGESKPTDREGVAASSSGVVVLPFENLGPPEDEYFAAGITEVITSRLAAIEGMRVISRNSASRYAGSGKTLQEIGTELGVDHVLEGSVRWAQTGGDSRVRITPRLTRVRDDAQVWSETYDRVFEDVFEVESEIADSVSRSLGVTLLARDAPEQQRLTDSPEAYQAYLRGLDHRRGTTLDERQLGIDMFVRAVELDPDFAQAWAHLAWLYSNRHFNGDFRDDWRSLAGEAIGKALALAPDDPLVELANGFFQYYIHRRFDDALEIFEGVVDENPNDVDALSAVAYIHRRQGKFEQTIAGLEQASALDPQNVEFRSAMGQTYAAMRRFEEAIAALDSALAIAPDQATNYVMKAGLLANWTGTTAAAREALRQAPGGEKFYQPWVQLDWIDRDFEAALERLEAYQPTNAFDNLNIPIQIGLTHLMAGDRDRARPYLEDSLEAIARVVETAEDSTLLSALAFLHGALGHRELAVQYIDEAIELTASDLYQGPSVVEAKAMIYALLGDGDAAIDIVEELLEKSYGNPITVPQLRTSPFWESLHPNPRFQAILERG